MCGGGGRGGDPSHIPRSVRKTNLQCMSLFVCNKQRVSCVTIVRKTKTVGAGRHVQRVTDLSACGQDAGVSWGRHGYPTNHTERWWACHAIRSNRCQWACHAVRINVNGPVMRSELIDVSGPVMQSELIDVSGPVMQSELIDVGGPVMQSELISVGLSCNQN